MGVYFSITRRLFRASTRLKSASLATVNQSIKPYTKCCVMSKIVEEGLFDELSQPDPNVPSLQIARTVTPNKELMCLRTGGES